MSQPNPRKWLFQPKWQLLLMTGLLALLVVPFNLAFSADWVIAGSFQNELPGAPCGDWDNSCAATTMEDTNGDGVSRLVADGLPAGSYEYKVVELGNWGNAHPANNVAITTNGGQVRWYFQPGANRVADNVNQCVATAAGSFQSELGGPGDWAPDDLRTMLWQEAPGSDWYSFTATIPAGTWEYKVARDEGWAESYPASNAVLNLAAESTVTFRYNCADNTVEHSTEAPPPPPEWVVAGNFQDNLPVSAACGEWNNACLETGMEDSNADGVYRFVGDNLPAGGYEYKIVEYNNWNNAYPANNVGFAADGGQMRWYFQPGANRVADNANQCIATVAGNLQPVIGGPEWSPDNLRTMLWQEAPGSDWYSFTVTLPAGSYEYKVARNEAWDESYPGSNVSLSVPSETAVTIRYNCADNIVEDSINNPSGGAEHDNDIWWNDLGHDSRDTLFRTPGGAVEAGTAVTLRLRAASNDLTSAQVRVWDDRINAQMLLNMTLAADDGTYEYWEATVPASSTPTIYWYWFIARDGTAVAYYEDDATRNGGWGQTFGDSVDNSWQLTVYDPSFQTPDWVKNGIMYQIFPERFRDGDPANNTPAGSFHYNIAGGSIVRSDGTDWNTPICDPRDENACFQIYGQNFYGGDLQGILDKLDYLQDLGVTVIYMNPIFESPSNHKYDTTDFGVIDDNFGDLALFQTLAAEAHSRGMSLVLDGVFNHSSSDSIYFDRYNRYASEGACESVSSPFRSWYNFSPQTAGPCAGDTTYESWFGFDSLPKLNSADQGVRDYIWAGGEDAIARYWMQWADGWRLDVGGDVDPGLTNDANNDYWEGFRDAVHTTNPDAYIVGEEWNVATAWTLGQEWDATMNYQFGSAIMSFWRDSDFVDNDHNSGSSAGILTPLTPSELDARLHNLEERYPPEAFQAMMNLLGSHDTNRALFMLDENTDLQDDTLYDNPNYDWSDAMTRLKGVVLLQMTMPGAPTIYYGDEVGLVGPVTWDGSTWQDDPYNRLPYPWLDETGTPFYTHLQSQASQDALFTYYQTLTMARNNSAALRVGSFDTLLLDDTANVYAYGRLLPDYSDAAVVVVNRATAAQAVTVNVSGYLPIGATFTDALNGGSYTVDAAGNIVLSSVPGMSGAVLVLDGALSAPPVAVSDLMVTAVSSSSIDLSWSSAAGASSYDVYRSLLSGGGYALIGNVTGTSFSDTGLTVATGYHYVVVGRDDATGLKAAHSNEVSAITAYTIGWANLQWSPTLNHTISTLNRTENVYGQIWIDGVTGQPGATPGLLAEVGFGPVSSTPSDSWTWASMAFNTDAGNNDEYVGTMLPDALGTFCYTTRYSGDGGNSWFYALNGPDEGNPTCPGPYGVLTVVASADTTAPSAPTNLAIAGTTIGSISLVWDAHPNTAGDLHGFELYRDGTRIATIANPAATSYTDTAVTTGTTYSYTLVAFDTSFNRSGESNAVAATAEARMVSVTFTVGVPAYTPGTVYIVGDLAEFGPWNPGLVPMTQVDATTWSYTLDIADGTAVQYKFTRGNWDTVEAWGAITGLTNRAMTVNYGSSGMQLVDLTATDWGTGPDDTKAVQLWRDPIVTAVSPANGATGVAVNTAVALTWSLPMDAGTSFTVSGPGGNVAGAFAADTTNQIITFTPAAPLAQGTTYTIAASGQVSNGNVQQVPVTFSFTTYAPTVAERFDALTAKLQALTNAGKFPGRVGQNLVIRSQRAKLYYSLGFNKPAILNLNVIVSVTNAMENAGFLSAADAAEVRGLATGLIATLLE
ncbi:MAG: alpha amylase N-terminal ig-like domain-containing protein [Ardenticatenaceae bacterium]|nr:alpha amylase N-terminal ig-like domain-containing protein [Ardenticatenaceae bacterium]